LVVDHGPVREGVNLSKVLVVLQEVVDFSGGVELGEVRREHVNSEGGVLNL